MFRNTLFPSVLLIKNEEKKCMEHPDIDQIEELLPRYCEGVATAEERLQVESWMDESAENRRVAKQIEMLYLATDTAHILTKIDTEKALKKVRNKMIGKRTTLWEWAQRTAALLFIPLLAAFLVQYMGRQSEVAQLIEVKTNPGMTTSVTLPDSTVVLLNSASSLSYPTCFKGDTREVILKGEAYFAVAKDKKKKFIISTSHHSQIEVLGTHFNVEAYENDAEVSTTLVEGKVCFLFKAKDDLVKKVMMNPGQKLVYNSTNSNVQLYATSGLSETAWKDGKIVFDNTPLDEGLKMLEKRYNVTFIIKNDRLKDNSFTGVFAGQRLERILEYFKVSSEIRWRYLESPDMKDEKSKIEVY